MSLIPKSEFMPTFEFKTTFTRPAPDGEPPDIVIKSGKSKFSKRELLEFFDRFFQKLEGQIEGAKKQAEIQAGECLLIEPVSNALKWCLQDLKLYINTYGGE